MVWKIEFDPRARDELARLDRPVAQRIARFFSGRVLEDPRSIGEPLHGPRFGRFWKYRVGDYRLICDIQDKAIKVLVVRIGHRRAVYR
ncbi:MAG: type II toxin-antitoxin system RelE family toxin [Gammaproteobacteria bacterium]